MAVSHSPAATDEAVATVLVARAIADRKLAVLVDRVGDDLRSETLRESAPLQAQLRERASHGFAPSFIRLCGASGLEKPFNRLIGWWADEHGDHGGGRSFLAELTRVLGPPELAADVARGARIETRVEQAVGEESREPDLVVWSDRGVLLVENKVLSGESGERQYDDYLAILRQLAGERPHAAVLMARHPRPLPPGWSAFLLHAELAQMFDVVTEDRNVPAWGRIAAAISAATLRDRDVATMVRRTGRLLRKAQGDLRAHDVLAMRQLIGQLGPSAEPWRPA